MTRAVPRLRGCRRMDRERAPVACAWIRRRGPGGRGVTSGSPAQKCPRHVLSPRWSCSTSRGFGDRAIRDRARFDEARFRVQSLGRSFRTFTDLGWSTTWFGVSSASDVVGPLAEVIHRSTYTTLLERGEALDIGNLPSRIGRGRRYPRACTNEVPPLRVFARTSSRPGSGPGRSRSLGPGGFVQFLRDT